MIIKNSKFKIPFEICVTRLHLEKSKLDLKGLGRGAIEEAIGDGRSDPIVRVRKVCQRGDQWLARAIFRNEKESHPDKI